MSLRKIGGERPEPSSRNHIGDLMNKFPIRCFTCGKIIGHLYREYEYRVNKGEDRGKIMDDLGLNRYCCRRHFLAFEGVEDRSILINEYVTEEVK